MNNDPTILQFPLVFDDTTRYEDRLLLKSLQVVRYFREHLPLCEIHIEKCGGSELRINLRPTNSNNFWYGQSYRIKMSDKPADKLSVLTGQGQKYCIGLDTFVSKIEEKIAQND